MNFLAYVAHQPEEGGNWGFRAALRVALNLNFRRLSGTNHLTKYLRVL